MTLTQKNGILLYYTRMKHRVPYAIGNFEELIEGGYYFVDKTAYLRHLEFYKAPIFLRPRRFGKSLWCSILECYYDVNRRERFHNLFGPIDIGQNPTPEHNSYLVLRFNFSKVTVEADYQGIRENFNAECLNSFRIFLAHYANYFTGEVTLREDASAERMLADLLARVLMGQFPPIYLIIDEYDNFTNQLVSNHQDALYREVTTGDSFLRSFFKVIKAGVEDRSIRRVFITGVLPITIDDLTSGFNIAQMITLAPATLSMLGFTQAEVDGYLDTIFAEYGYQEAIKPQVQQLVKEFYNGYAFLPEVDERLYNSTVITYFLDQFVQNNGVLPRDFIDDNLRTDVNWIKRLASGEQSALAVVEKVLLGEELPYEEKMLRSKFNMEQFFDRNFFPISLFYLGMLTIKDHFSMMLPNQTMRELFTEYFNTLAHIGTVQGYGAYFEQFLIDLDLGKLFTGYWEIYVGQLPAQIFDKINENFFRTTFFELCSRYLAHSFTFGVEVNHLSGRSDWEMLGKPDSAYANQKFVMEFKYAPAKGDEKKNWLKLDAPLPADIEQVNRYAEDIHHEFPQFTVRKYIVYIVGRKGFLLFHVGTDGPV